MLSRKFDLKISLNVISVDSIRILVVYCSVIYPAGGIFGKGAAVPVGQLYRIADNIRKPGVPFNLQNNRRTFYGNGRTFGIQEIRMEKAGPNMGIYGDSYIAGAIRVGFSCIIDNGFRA